MPTIRANILNADDASAAGVVFTQTSADSANMKRHRPAIIRGSGVREFCSFYFNHPGAVPAGGIYSTSRATIIVDGLVLKGHNLLLSARYMLPADMFPLEWSSPRFHDRHGDTISIDLPEGRVSLPGVTVNMISLGWQVYGHWLIDVMPRIDRIQRSGVVIDRYLFGAPTADWQYRLIEACGIPLEKCTFIDLNHNVVECDMVLTPTLDRLHSELHPDFIKVHHRLRKKFSLHAIPNRDIFIARSKWGGSKPLTNRGEVEFLIRNLGFDVIYPEQLSLPEQIHIFHSARSVIGEMGSAMHSTVFSQPGTKVCLIQSSTNLNFIQAQISAICNHEIFYVLGQPRTTTGSDDEFSVNETDIRYVASRLRD